MASLSSPLITMKALIPKTPPTSLTQLLSTSYRTLKVQYIPPTRPQLPSKPFSSSPPRPMDPIPVLSTISSPLDGNSSSSSIDAGNSIRKPLSLWPGMYHSPVTNALWEARSSIFEWLLDPSKDKVAPTQSELLTRTPAQSRTSIVYNFSSDYILREQYRDPWNEVRIGKLLEDLDALAGTIAVKHCSDDHHMTRPLLLVTASVDKMVLKKPLGVDTDLKIEGAVTWVGRSSIAIQIEVTQSQKESATTSDPTALTANFTFVARDSKTGKSAPVNHFSPETVREKLLFEECEKRDRQRKRKREEQARELENGHSIHGETGRLNALLAEGRVFCDLPALADRDSILIRDTCFENSLICQPQQRNLHGRIFGGFLMHRAFELAFSTVYAFVGQMPHFLEVDHVDFLKPVDVGDFLRLKSCVLYTQRENPGQPIINIEVVAHVTRPELRTSEVSNTFYFKFTVNGDSLKNGLRIRNVVPATEEEARRVLERMDAEESFGHADPIAGSASDPPRTCHVAVTKHVIITAVIETTVAITTAKTTIDDVASPIVYSRKCLSGELASRPKKKLVSRSCPVSRPLNTEFPQYGADEVSTVAQIMSKVTRNVMREVPDTAGVVVPEGATDT